MNESEHSAEDETNVAHFPPELATDTGMRHELSRDIVMEKQALLMDRYHAIERELSLMTEKSKQLDQQYPENALSFTEQQQLYRDLESQRQRMRPENPDFERIVAQLDRVRELVTLGSGEEIEYPTAMSENVKRMSQLHEEREQILEQFQKLERRKYGTETDLKERMHNQLYPTPGSELN